MVKYFLTNRAVQDLEEIWDYTVAEWSEQQAEIYYQMLINTFQEIAKKPGAVRKYSAVAMNLYGMKSGKHIIFYRKTEPNTIEITRILHEMMDLKKRIKE